MISDGTFAPIFLGLTERLLMTFSLTQVLKTIARHASVDLRDDLKIGLKELTSIACVLAVALQ